MIHVILPSLVKFWWNMLKSQKNIFGKLPSIFLHGLTSFRFSSLQDVVLALLTRPFAGFSYSCKESCKNLWLKYTMLNHDLFIVKILKIQTPEGHSTQQRRALKHIFWICGFNLWSHSERNIYNMILPFGHINLLWSVLCLLSIWIGSDVYLFCVEEEWSKASTCVWNMSTYVRLGS
jgi:hypothetical protein